MVKMVRDMAVLHKQLENKNLEIQRDQRIQLLGSQI